MTNPFEWGYLTTVPKSWTAYGPFAIAFLTVFGLGLVGTWLTSRILGRRYRDHALFRRLLDRGTQIFGWVFGVGLLFFGLRALELPFLGMRLWLYLCLLALIGAIGFVAWYLRFRYPAARERYEQQQERQRYLQPVSSGRRRRRGRVTT